MSIEMSKTYEPKQSEHNAYQLWLDNKVFHGTAPCDGGVAGDPYAIVIPPPNVTGVLHMGHALNNTLQDLLIRFRKMQGMNTLWMPGTDHAGIATQTVVEKRILKDEGKNRHEFGREPLLEEIWRWKESYGNTILDQLKSLGASCDWDRTRFTLDDMCAKAVRHTFVKLFEADLIYRGKRLVNWDPATETALADDEVDHKEIKGHFWHIRYPLSDGSGYIVVATTRPETMLGDSAVAVNPKDENAARYIGKTIMLPLMNREIPIITDDYVKRGEGTGFLKVTPAHDPNDYDIGLRHNLEMINIMTSTASINENGGVYEGLDRFAARRKIVADLQALDLVEKIVDHVHQVGHSYRSNVPIEPYLSDQWYVKVQPLAQPAADAVRDGRIKFHPERYGKTYVDWLDGMRDWCISRQIWWGHRIPIWHCEDCQALTTGLEDPTTCSGCQGENITQDPDVLDTWFSSALWPFSTMGWPEKTAELDFYYPTSTLVTGRDIITLWVSRMVMMGLFNLGEVPFNAVYINGTILDGKGVRMSKSKGNGIDPVEIIEIYGADAMRFSLIQMATESQDMRLPVKQDEQGRNTSDKFDIGRNFCNKLWNASRFALGNLDTAQLSKEVSVSDLEWEDKWIISKLNVTVKSVTAEIDKFKFSEPVTYLYRFFWNDLCDWYLEMIKPRMHDDARRPIAQKIFVYVLDHALKLLHPFMPFITEGIYQQLNSVAADRQIAGLKPIGQNDLLSNSLWPTLNDEMVSDTIEAEMTQLQNIIRLVREVRANYNLGLKEPYTVSVKCSNDIATLIAKQGRLACIMANLTSITAGKTLQKPDNAAVTISDAMEIYVHDAVDVEAELEKLTKQKEKIQGFIANTEKKLGNENFVSRAKPEIVQRERDLVADLIKQLATIDKNINDLSK